ncbi:twin transmembrane helix small protein [Aureimonas frigidaquae]|nr:twin transmembrane helix small protein [Aureimonas frigidaquae]
MSSFLTYLALALMIAVALVLVAGLRNMLVGGPGNRSQKLMRLRVMLQALAVLVIVLFLLFAR